MINFSELGKCDVDIPINWQHFFISKYLPEFASLQDTTHILVKLMRRMLKTIIIGDKIVSTSVLELIVHRFPKTQHLMTISDFKSKDKMSLSVVLKVLHPGVEGCLKKSTGHRRNSNLHQIDEISQNCFRGLQHRANGKNPMCMVVRIFLSLLA